MEAFAKMFTRPTSFPGMKERARHVQDGLFALWKKQELVDYTLKVGRHKFKVHRLVLAATSPRYRNLLTKGIKDGCSEVKGLSPTTVESIVFFMYTSEIEIRHDNIEEIKKADKYFQIPGLTELCTMFKQEQKEAEYVVGENVIIQGLRSIWDNKDGFDFKVRTAEDKEFRAHKVILCATSEYFHRKLVDMPEQRAIEYELTSISGFMFGSVLKMIYTGYVELIFYSEYIKEMLVGATKLGIPAATDLFSSMLLRDITLENWVWTANLLWSCEQMNAMHEVQRFFYKNTPKLTMKTTDIGELEHNVLMFIVNHYQGLEDDLLILIGRWNSGRLALGKPKCEELFCEIRYCLLQPAILKKSLRVIHENPDLIWREKVEEAKEYQQLPMHRRVLHVCEQNTVRTDPCVIEFQKNTMANIHIPSVHGYIENQYVNLPKGHKPTGNYHEVNDFLVFQLRKGPKIVCHLFDPRTTEWFKMADMPFECLTAPMTPNEEFVYMVGGTNEDFVSTNQVNRYSFRTNKWQTISKVPLLLNSHAVCCLDNGLYMSGGFPDWFKDSVVDNNYNASCEKVGLKTLYRLNLSTLEWEIKAPMLRKHYKHNSHVLKIRSKSVLCVLNKDLTIEYYKPQTNQWSVLKLNFNQPPPSLRNHTWVVRHNNVYMIGANTECEGQTVLAFFNIPKKAQGKDSMLDTHSWTTTSSEFFVVAAIQPNAIPPQEVSAELSRPFKGLSV